MSTITIEETTKSIFKAKLQHVKEEQKKRAIEIRKLRSKRKEVPFGRVPGLESLSYEYRLFHIAYCELRGTPRELIEAKCDNPPDESWIQRIKDAVLSTDED